MRTDDPKVRLRLGAAITDARGSRSQEWLAEKLGVHQTTISQWERGITAPMPSRFHALEEVLWMPPGTLRAIAFGDGEDEADAPAADPPPLVGKLARLSPRDLRIVERLVDDMLDGA